MTESTLKGVIQDFYRPYFKAVKKILDGNPVKDLDEIRLLCESAFLKAVSLGVEEKVTGYWPEMIVFTAVADAENSILDGTDPGKAYADRALGSIETRPKARALAETTIQDFLY